jgi:hypothetical protein
MDSASPIAQCIAGEYTLDTGITFTSTFAMRTKVENTLKRFGFDRPGGYRHRYYRSYGEGHPV